MINRVTMETLNDKLDLTQESITILPSEISETVGRSLSEPIETIQSNQAAVKSLTQELRRNSVIEVSLKSTGWRGVICALEAIAQHQSLGLTVAGITIGTAALTGWIVWGIGWGNRSIIQFNRQSIEECYEKFAMDKDRNGWFSCPGIQLPMR